MNTFVPYTAESSCILKGGDTADHRMRELGLLIASGKGNIRPPKDRDLMRTRMQALNREETISSRHPAAAPLMLGSLDRISRQASEAARTCVSARNLVIETLLVKLRYERYDVNKRICYLERLASSHQENEMSSAKEPGHPQGRKNG